MASPLHIWGFRVQLELGLFRAWARVPGSSVVGGCFLTFWVWSDFI